MKNTEFVSSLFIKEFALPTKRLFYSKKDNKSLIPGQQIVNITSLNILFGIIKAKEDCKHPLTLDQLLGAMDLSPYHNIILYHKMPYVFQAILILKESLYSGWQSGCNVQCCGDFILLPVGGTNSGLGRMGNHQSQVS